MKLPLALILFLSTPFLVRSQKHREVFFNDQESQCGPQAAYYSGLLKKEIIKGGKYVLELNFPNGNLFRKGYYLDPEMKIPDGKFRRYNSGGVLVEVLEYENGKLSGECMQWYENGKPKETAFYWRGLLEGKRTRWHPNGQMSMDAFYSGGLPEGEVREWEPDGQMTREVYFKRGVEDGIYREFMDGQMITQGQYKNGMPVGKWEYRSQNGTLVRSGTYQNGLQVGWWISIDPATGKEIREFFRCGGPSGYAGADRSTLCRISRTSDSEGISNQYFGYINQKGEEVLPASYDWLGLPENGLILVKKQGKYGYVNLKNEAAIPIIYEELGKLREGMIKASLNGKWGYLNVRNETVVPFKYDQACDFSGGLGVVKTGHLYHKINTQGEQVSASFSDYWECFEILPQSHFSTDFMGKDLETPDGKPFRINRVGNDGKIGAVDLEGNIIVPTEYDEVGPYLNGMIRVRKGEKWGFFNDFGQQAIPLIFDSAENFEVPSN